MPEIEPETVFGTGYYWYNWLRQSYPDLLEELKAMSQEFDPYVFELPEEDALEQPMGEKMPREWWLRWAGGLLKNVYPVMQIVMQPEYVEFWLEGLRLRLAKHGIAMAEAFEAAGE